jgi:integrase
MGRFQTGYIYEAFNAFHVRYYVTEIIDGHPKRVQKSHRLCSKDEKHHSRTCKPVKKLCADFMFEINNQNTSRANERDITVKDFWEKTYLTFIEKELRKSTVHGYKQIWGASCECKESCAHLERHFGKITLKEYRTPTGSQFLTALKDNYGRNTIQHIRSLASGIFSHALNLGLIESNPWHDVKILGKTKKPKETEHYTLKEVEDIISALVDHVECQLIIALAFFLGLRPSEIQGLQWDDVDGDWLHIRRGVVRGIVDETKTEQSADSVPLIQPVKGIFELWRKSPLRLPSKWVFPNGAGKPLDLKSVNSRVIRPILKEAKIKWKGIYAGRRGAGTILTELTGSALAAKDLLRHTNLTTTEKHYLKPTPETLLRGMKLLEAAATSSK